MTSIEPIRFPFPILGLDHLTNKKRGDYYGMSATLCMKQRRKMGAYLITKSLQIFLAEGERQISPLDIKSDKWILHRLYVWKRKGENSRNDRHIIWPMTIWVFLLYPYCSFTGTNVHLLQKSMSSVRRNNSICIPICYLDRIHLQFICCWIYANFVYQNMNKKFPSN